MNQSKSEQSALSPNWDLKKEAQAIITRFSGELAIDQDEMLTRFSLSAEPSMSHHGITDLLIRQAAARIAEEPDYSTFAVRLLNLKISDEELNYLAKYPESFNCINK